MSFTNLEVSRVDLGEITTRVRHGGSGPPLLLLHGCPQTHMMWGQIADQLAQHFTIIAPDIRGYGECSLPLNCHRADAYSKRTMAIDAVNLMERFGFPKFSVAGHDRGGRIAYRLALDHPERVKRLSVLDIVPTLEVWARADARLMQSYWHWALLALPAPRPEEIIRGMGAERFLLDTLLGGLSGRDFIDPVAYADYARSAVRRETIHGICEDYRAGAGIDRRHDEAEFGRTMIKCPVQVLWGANGIVGQLYRPLEVWSAWAAEVCGEAIDAGHFLAEENPRDTLAALLTFFK